MQFFRDEVSGAVFSFEDDVSAVQEGNVWRFYAPGQSEPLPGPYPEGLSRTDDPTPPPYVPSLEERKVMRDVFLSVAATKIGPLQDAVDLGVATEKERGDLLLLKQYRVDLNRLDLNVSPVEWPQEPA